MRPAVFKGNVVGQNACCSRHKTCQQLPFQVSNKSFDDTLCQYDEEVRWANLMQRRNVGDACKNQLVCPVSLVARFLLYSYERRRQFVLADLSFPLRSSRVFRGMLSNENVTVYLAWATLRVASKSYALIISGLRIQQNSYKAQNKNIDLVSSSC